MRGISLLVITAALTSCAMAPQPPLQRSAGSDAQLHQLIAGKVAGKPQSCLPGSPTDNIIIIDDNTVFYRVGSQLYRQDFGGGTCSGLGSGAYALVTKQFSGTLCRGDVAHVMDTGSGVAIGTCIVGDFVPYLAAR